MTPTDKAAIEGLIQKWRKLGTEHDMAATKGAIYGDGYDDACIALSAELEQALQRLLSGETREAVGELREHEGRISFHTLVPIEKLKAGPLYSSPSPHDDAGADKSAGVPVSELRELMASRFWDSDTCRHLLNVLLERHQDPHHG